MSASSYREASQLVKVEVIGDWSYSRSKEEPITKRVMVADKICEWFLQEPRLDCVLEPIINSLERALTDYDFGTGFAKSKNELRKKRKGRNDQGNGGCADCFGPSLFLSGRPNQSPVYPSTKVCRATLKDLAY